MFSETTQFEMRLEPVPDIGLPHLDPGDVLLDRDGP
jgi:hypothetical protein